MRHAVTVTEIAIRTVERLRAERRCIAKPGRFFTHGDGCLAHAYKGISASFRGWTLFDKVTEDRSCNEHREVNVVESEL